MMIILKLEESKRGGRRVICRYDLSYGNYFSISFFSRYVMIVGMKGAGKSLLINNIISYVYGVDYTNNFRFKLIVEEEEIKELEKGSSTSQAHSMKSWASAFTLHHQK